MRPKPRLVWMAVVGAGLGVAGIALVRSGALRSPRGVPLSELSMEQLSDQAQAAFRRYGMVDLRSVDTPSSLFASLSAVPVNRGSRFVPKGVPEVGSDRIDADVDAVVHLASEFIIFRFARSLEHFHFIRSVCTRSA